MIAPMNSLASAHDRASVEKLYRVAAANNESILSIDLDKDETTDASSGVGSDCESGSNGCSTANISSITMMPNDLMFAASLLESLESFDLPWHESIEMVTPETPEDVFVIAMRDRMPLKVQPPAAAPPPVYLSAFEGVPMKKRPNFYEMQHITEAVARVANPAEPIKKRPSHFLLKDPPSCSNAKAIRRVSFSM
mmetsp:Transcript_35320/g.70222  ORF Transcript_35320/g.70222 Transcript_35320/m.70222 type:complete len:194 (-) Transcript_35320:188-769(-)